MNKRIPTKGYSAGLLLILLAVFFHFSPALGQEKTKNNPKDEHGKRAKAKKEQVITPANEQSSQSTTKQDKTLIPPEVDSPIVDSLALLDGEPNPSYQKYVMAMRWNDSQVAKNALYDLIIQNLTSDSLIFSLAYLYYESQEYASAALVCQDLLRKSPKNINYLSVSAASLEALGALEKALESYETIYLLGDDLAALYKVALLQYRMQRNEECATNIDILISKPSTKTIMVSFNDENGNAKQYPMNLAVTNLKGLLYEQRGDQEKAKQSYRDALKLDPSFLPAKSNLEKLEKTKGN